MSFGLTQSNPEEPQPKRITPERPALAAPNTLSLVGQNFGPKAPPSYLANPGRIEKRQIRCRKCHKEVEKTAQYGEQSGRRVIVCNFYCHGENGVIKICDDQLTPDMVFDVFEGEPSLRGYKNEPPALTDNKPAERAEESGGPITIEAEVIPLSEGAI